MRSLIALVLIYSITAHAAPCSEQIARVEMALRQTQTDRRVAPTAEEALVELYLKAAMPGTQEAA